MVIEIGGLATLKARNHTCILAERVRVTRLELSGRSVTCGARPGGALARIRRPPLGGLSNIQREIFGIRYV